MHILKNIYKNKSKLNNNNCFDKYSMDLDHLERLISKIDLKE
jgi:hypothetical protein